MKKITRIIILVGLCICLFGCENDSEKYFDQWIEKNGNKYYYDEKGKRQEGWFKYQGNWYYFQSGSGRMVKNQ